jgi:prepilin-type N-terminal cleavage/methylation domain-containing protein
MNARRVIFRRTDFQSVRAARRTDCQSVLPLWGRLPICPTARRGFTLVELLVVIVILTMLSALVVVALRGAQESAREAKTKATIAKLHGIVMEIHESYRTRRVPITIPPGMSPSVAAQMRLQALRDLMRMEMPEGWNDVTLDPITPIARPSLSQAYYSRFNQARVYLTTPVVQGGQGLTQAEAMELLGRYGSAECLYAIVSMAGEDAIGQFAADEIGDVDGDGLREFVDGWGNPIAFLRWAPGFVDSDLQPNPGDDLQARQYAAINDHDPFDPRRIDMSRDHTDPNDPPRGWRLVPLIYSAGRDGIYDINTGGPQFAFTGNPYFAPGPPPLPLRIGAPVDSINDSKTATGPPNGSLDHYDNIHNHSIEAQ